MSQIRDRALAKIRERYGSPVELAAELLVKVAMGEETVDVFRPSKNGGELVLFERRVRQTQQSMANGVSIMERLLQDPKEREMDALLPDTLRLSEKNPYAEHLRRLDRSIVAREDNTSYVGHRPATQVVDISPSAPATTPDSDPFK